MTEQPLLPPLQEPPEPIVAAPKAPRLDLIAWFYGLGFLILAAAIFYLWQYPGMPRQSSDEATALQTIEQHLADIGARLNRLEQQPTPDLGKIIPRLDALDGHAADQTRLASRLDTISGRIESLSARDQTGLDANKQQLDAVTGRIAALDANAGNLAAVTKRLNRIVKLQEASFALAAGRPVGDLPDAPEALARYAHNVPPTEAQLRLRFPGAEQAALAAKHPDDSEAPFIDRVWERAQSLVTVRRGEDVVVGNPSAIALSRARASLEGGDLGAAVDAVESLKGRAGPAMADWLADAKALLGARSALADMVARA